MAQRAQTAILHSQAEELRNRDFSLSPESVPGAEGGRMSLSMRLRRVKGEVMSPG